MISSLYRFVSSTDRVAYRCRIFVCAAVAFWLPCGSAIAQGTAVIQGRGVDTLECGSLENSVGPFDYRQHVLKAKDREDILYNVEVNHFNENVEFLRKGMTGSLGEDLGYVLRAFPNHHRALLSLYRLSARERSERISGLRYPVPCWYERAIELAPDDAKVRELYAAYLSRSGKNAAALAQYRAALDLGAADSNTYYNLGLLYFEIKEYDTALEYAQKAYAGGFPLPGLKDKLRRVGKWRDASPTTNETAPPNARTAPP